MKDLDSWQEIMRAVQFRMNDQLNAGQELTRKQFNHLLEAYRHMIEASFNLQKMWEEDDK